MKKLLIILFTALTCTNAFATADLLDAYQAALTNDPTYLQSVASLRSTKQNLPISVAALLPAIAAQATPSITKTHNLTTSTLPPNTTLKYYKLTLSLSQTVFDFGKFSTVGKTLATSKSADAQLNAALQSLMTRLASAYFAVLQNEETLNYARASKKAYANQLNQVKQQYQVGVKTITDVYAAEASYEASTAEVLAAETKFTCHHWTLLSRTAATP
jgi:outer membrane protein